MRNLLFIFLLVVMISCKNDTKDIDNLPDTETSEDSVKHKESDLDLSREKILMSKRQELLNKKDARVELENLIITHSFVKKEDWYTLDFKYPMLNEKIDIRYGIFNDYISKNYLNAET